MSYIGDCIRGLEDKPDSFFQAEEVDVLDCISTVMAQMKDGDGNVLTDNEGKHVLTEVQTITNISKFKIAKELQTHRTRKKEEER